MERAGLTDQNAMILLGEKLIDSKVIIKYSKIYEGGGYWFGIAPKIIEQCESEEVSHLVFILGYEGVVKLPFDVFLKYIENADKTYKKDSNDVKHYHIRFKYTDKVILFNKKDNFDISNYFFYDENVVDEDLSKKSKSDILREAMDFKDYNTQYKDSINNKKIRNESSAQKERIAILEDHICQVCGFQESYKNQHGNERWIIDVDHINNKASGGGEAINNLWVLCPNCHRKKTNGIILINVKNKIVMERGKEIKIRDNHLGLYE